MRHWVTQPYTHANQIVVTLFYLNYRTSPVHGVDQYSYSSVSCFSIYLSNLYNNANDIFFLLLLQSHYSFKKAAAMLGFGLNAVRLVAVDDGGRMCPTALDRAIQEALDEVS